MVSLKKKGDDVMVLQIFERGIISDLKKIRLQQNLFRREVKGHGLYKELIWCYVEDALTNRSNCN